MNRYSDAPTRFDVQMLAQAVRENRSPDAVPLNLSPSQWTTLADFLQPMALPAGQVLLEQGVKDRAAFFVESGSLTVHDEDDNHRSRMAIVGPGTMLGEGAFFSQLPRSASVDTGTACRLWTLTPLRYRELSARHPALALDLTVAMATVLARRLYLRAQRTL